MPSTAKDSEKWVIKIGGSLYNSQNLKIWLDKISKHSNKNIIIVPGGGPFADQVRHADGKFDLEPAIAHHMAVMAMQQYAGVLKSICPALLTANSAQGIQQAWNSSKIVVWEPYEMVRDQCKLANSWEISSDSLAVWLAGMLKINNLLLVKSSHSVLDNPDLKMLIKNRCIDSGIEELANINKVNIQLLHKSEVDELSELINSV